MFVFQLFSKFMNLVVLLFVVFSFYFFVFSVEPFVCQTFVGVSCFSAVNSGGVHQTQNITHQTQNITHRQSNSKVSAASEDQTRDHDLGAANCAIAA